MTFPYRPSVHDDLRTLFGVQSREATARNLGSSSITRGEGSLDLLAADGGSVQARIGDQNDGRFGVSFTHRGSLQFLSDVIGTAEDATAALSSTVEAHGNRLDLYRDQINDSQARLTSVEGRNATQDQRLTAAEGRNATQDGRLDQHDSQIANRVTTGQLGETNSRVTAVEGRNATQDGRLDSLDATISGIQSTNSTQNSRLTAVEGRNATQDGRLDTHDSQIANRATTSRVENLEGTVSTLISRMNDVQSTVTRIENWLTRNTVYPNNPN